MRAFAAALVAAALVLAPAARAEVSDSQPAGFEITRSVVIAAPAAKVWAALARPAGWWNHSWSGDPNNFDLQLKAGGCWCETLANGGSASHMRVIYVDPGKVVRMEGALGPLSMTGLTGHWQWLLKEKDGATTLTWVYDVGGYAKGGLATWSGAVDGVLGEQIGRLKALVETGKPD